MITIKLSENKKSVPIGIHYGTPIGNFIIHVVKTEIYAILINLLCISIVIN
jgi:hypothetical protein